MTNDPVSRDLPNAPAAASLGLLIVGLYDYLVLPSPASWSSCVRSSDCETCSSGVFAACNQDNNKIRFQCRRRIANRMDDIGSDDKSWCNDADQIHRRRDQPPSCVVPQSARLEIGADADRALVSLV